MTIPKKLCLFFLENVRKGWGTYKCRQDNPISYGYLWKWSIFYYPQFCAFSWNAWCKSTFSNPEWLSYGTSGLSPALSVNIDTNYPATTELNSTISKTSVALSFSTDELTMSTVSYGTPSSLWFWDVTVSASLQNNHSVVISGLNTCNRYHYRIQTTDKAGNVSTTSDATFLTTLCGGVSNSLPTVETPSVQNTPYSCASKYSYSLNREASWKHTS